MRPPPPSSSPSKRGCAHPHRAERTSPEGASASSSIDSSRESRELGDSVMLEGALVVELRVERAPTTKDVDLRIVSAPTGLLERLARAARLEPGDFMLLTVAPDTEHPDITNEGMLYEGQR
jgi:hypothetical protein